MKIFSLVRNLIKRARITKGGDDTEDFNIQQAEYMGQAGDIEAVFPYGMSANLPVNSLVLLFNVNANEQNRAGIGTFPQQRKKNLEEGEVAFFHPPTQSFIYFRKSGDIDICTPTDDSVSQGAFSIGFGNAFDTGNVAQYSSAFSSAFATAKESTGSPANINIKTQNINIDTVADANITVGGQAFINATGNAEVTAGDDITIDAGNNVNINAPGRTIVSSPGINLGGGPGIARVGDSVQVTVTSGSSAGVYSGTITTGSTNNTSN